MRFSFFPICGLMAAACVSAQTPPAQESQPQDSLARVEGMPPRTAPGDYGSQGKAGDITVGAEFSGHTIPTPDGPLSSEEYIVIEAGFFGASGSRLKLAQSDFSLRVNGSKKTIASEPFALVLSTVKDPEWAPPDPEKSSTKLAGLSTHSGGPGAGQQDAGPPKVPKPPFDVQRKLELRVKKISMPEGERPLPQAGLIYFKYRGKEKGIRSLELIYEGAAGSVTIPMHP